MNQPQTELPLDFHYDAEYRGIDQLRRFTGTVRMSDWQSETVKDPSAAVWAFVRGLCDRQGQWDCTATIIGGISEHRVVNVLVIKGTMCRTDAIRSRMPAERQPKCPDSL